MANLVFESSLTFDLVQINSTHIKIWPDSLKKCTYGTNLEFLPRSYRKLCVQDIIVQIMESSWPLTFVKLDSYSVFKRDLQLQEIDSLSHEFSDPTLKRCEQHSTIPIMEISLTFGPNQIQLIFGLDLHFNSTVLVVEFSLTFDLSL